MEQQARTFEQIRDLSEAKGPPLSWFDQESFGPFPFRMHIAGLRREEDYPYFDYDIDQSTRARIRLTDEAVFEIGVSIGEEWWELSRHGISCSSRCKGEPADFRYHFIACPEDPARHGSLEQLTYARRDKKSGVSFSYFGGQESCSQSLDDSYPQSLIGLTEFQGVPIPWKIDFDAKAAEILKASRLQEFIECVASGAALDR